MPFSEYERAPEQQVGETQEVQFATYEPTIGELKAWHHAVTRWWSLSPGESAQQENAKVLTSWIERLYELSEACTSPNHDRSQDLNFHHLEVTEPLLRRITATGEQATEINRH